VAVSLGFAACPRLRIPSAPIASNERHFGNVQFRSPMKSSQGSPAATPGSGTNGCEIGEFAVQGAGLMRGFPQPRRRIIFLVLLLLVRTTGPEWTW
jgi:hypothetical protein